MKKRTKLHHDGKISGITLNFDRETLIRGLLDGFDNEADILSLTGETL